MTTDTTERALEDHICTLLTSSPAHTSDAAPTNKIGDRPAVYGAGWLAGNPDDYDRAYCVDLAQLTAFLSKTQPKQAAALALNEDTPTRRNFLARLQREIDKRGIVDVLRKGIKHGRHELELFFGKPTPGNDKAKKLYAANRFSVTRQLRYSDKQKRLALDLALFVNGMPIATFELKNSLTKQTVGDAERQYQRDRSPREKLFAPGRCVAHFAVDEHEVRFCTHLQGEASRFLPFNKGWESGAGNPPTKGIKTDYLWQETLTRESLTDVLENYAQFLPHGKQKTGGKSGHHIWPRYHQLDVVRKLLADARLNGAGRRYLIQHSAGSGKSNSIAWLAHRLIDLTKDGTPVFDSIIVVTDRILLDRQIRDTIKQFTQVRATVGHAQRANDLRRLIESGKKIIISTVQKFRFILGEIDNQPHERKFAIIIDEAHSGQGGKGTTDMSKTLSNETFEDKINRLMEGRKMLPNASYFAFTATPKNKTLEMFGKKEPQPDGKVRHDPFHSYTMKQAIDEGFIVDVLANYTPVQSYYHLAKKVMDDPEFDAKKAHKKLRHYVENHHRTVQLKAEIMVDHFHEQVVKKAKVGGEARAMVVTAGVSRAIKYYHAISAYLTKRNRPYQAIVAFSGERKHNGKKVSEASLNGFPSSQIVNKIKQSPYRILICADKFQTGYDEPLLHTMYVDKPLSGVKAVQTLSRLNRTYTGKEDVFVLDFANDVDTIREAFEPYYRTTILADKTDPNKLHDLQTALDDHQVYSQQQLEELVEHFLNDQPRERLDPILDTCVSVYLNDLDEDNQIDFKGKVKTFIRTYEFLASILPYTYEQWEKRSIFFNLLVHKLPSPVGEDLSKGVIQAVDMDSYRAEKCATMRIVLPDEDGEIEPVPTPNGGGKPEPELEPLAKIIAEFNEQWGGTHQWEDKDRVQRLITEDIPNRVKTDPAYRNACKNSDRQNALVEHDKALSGVMSAIMSDDTQLFKHYTDDEDFKQWLANTVFRLTYNPPPPDARK